MPLEGQALPSSVNDPLCLLSQEGLCELGSQPSVAGSQDPGARGVSGDRREKAGHDD